MVVEFFFLEFRRRLLLLQKTHFAFFFCARTWLLSFSLSLSRARLLSVSPSLSKMEGPTPGPVPQHGGRGGGQGGGGRGIRMASKIHASVAGEEAATVAATSFSSSSSSRTNSTLSIAINARGGTFEVSVRGRKRRKEKPKGGNRKRMASSREGEAFVSVCLFSPALRHAPRSSQEEGNVARRKPQAKGSLYVV